MSAPETDPFYDALRNRLHDYEEPLPTGGWAGIAQQLPPAPKPWWRRVPRRRLLLLLLLALLVPAVVLWQWQAQRGAAAEPAAAVAAKTSAPSTSSPANRDASSATASAASPAGGPADATATTATQAPTTAPGETGSPTARGAAGTSTAHNGGPSSDDRLASGHPGRIRTQGHIQHLDPGTSGSLVADTLGTAEASSEPTLAATAAKASARRRRSRGTVTLVAAAAARRRATRIHPQTPTATDAPAAHTAASRPAASAQSAGLANQNSAQPTGLNAAPATEVTPTSPAAGSPAQPASATTTVATLAPGSTEPGAASGLLSAAAAKRPRKSGITKAAPGSAESATSATDAAPTRAYTAAASATTDGNTAPDEVRERADESTLGSLNSSLLLMPGAALPAPLATPAGPRDSLRRMRPARLSFGMLLGTALPPARRPVTDSSSANRLPLRRLPGVSAELTARYRLSPSVALRSGVGYALHRQDASVTVEKRQAYWGRTTQTVVTNNPSGPDTLRLVSYGLLDSVVSRQRQRYQLAQQYLTLPLAVEWHPRTPFIRWQPVLGLGATASWLLRGSYITTNDGCNCQELTQRSSGAGPFAPVSMALTASLGLDYALGLRSVLLVRPAATYSLTSPARNGARGTWSAGLQVGWLFDAHRP